MGEVTMVRSHVERCLQDIWDQCRVHKDHDGDYPFSNGTSMCFVRVERGDPVVVRVFAYAVVGVRRSAKLLAELNDINNRCRLVSVGWHGDAVLVDHVMQAKAVSRATLREACSSVGVVADDIGSMIAAVYGGGTPIDADEAEAHEEAS
jgi:Putative bacterial sensory transduction regulator